MQEIVETLIKTLWSYKWSVVVKQADMMLLQMLKLLGLDDEIIIKKVGSEYFSDEYFAARPPNERLIIKSLI